MMDKLWGSLPLLPSLMGDYLWHCRLSGTMIRPSMGAIVGPRNHGNKICHIWSGEGHLAPVPYHMYTHIHISQSIYTIKNQITAYLWNQFTTNFNSDSHCSYHVICPCYHCSSQPDQPTPDYDLMLKVSNLIFS